MGYKQLSSHANEDDWLRSHTLCVKFRRSGPGKVGGTDSITDWKAGPMQAQQKWERYPELPRCLPEPPHPGYTKAPQ